MSQNSAPPNCSGIQARKKPADVGPAIAPTLGHLARRQRRLDRKPHRAGPFRPPNPACNTWGPGTAA
eukprot:9839845-Lingulodinium_polyedra.AAC.1